jgi:hypothetical protein
VIETNCHCGKVCKNLKGLRIHQAKTKCGSVRRQEERSGNTGQTEEDHSQDLHHRAEDLPLPEAASTSTEREPRDQEAQQVNAEPLTSTRLGKVKWPTSDDKQWEAFDDDLDKILESMLIGEAERKINTLTTMVYTIGKERFGTMEKGTRSLQPLRENRRQQEIKRIRGELKVLSRKFKSANETEKAGLHQLRDILRDKRNNLMKAERIRKSRKERAKKRSAFVANPYRFTSTVLEGKRSGKLTSPKEAVEEHLKKTHGDEQQWRPLGSCSRIEDVAPPEIPMDMKEPTWKEVTDIVKKSRSASAPGTNGIPYKVYKKCPKILRHLWKLMKVIWRKGKIPACWQLAEGCFVPKEERSESIEQFRTISLLNVEGKIFFSVLARRMTNYMVDNQYVDTSVQKGGVPGFSGCIEHTSIITQLVSEAKINKKDLTVVWLDLANAYGTIPHMLIQEALNHYHIPEHCRDMIRSYFSAIHLRFTVNNYTTTWQKLEKGIVTGCTISVILFVMGMNMIIKAGERETRGPKTATNIRQPPSRGFMDDLTITTDTVVQARWILAALEETAAWARMKFKPRKSRSLIILKGRVTQKYQLSVQGESIPSIVDNPIKCLGKWYDDTLGDQNNIKKIQQQVEESMRNIDKTCLPGKFKTWIYQHGVLPRIAWPLMLYEIGATAVEQLERTISKHIRKWLGLPPCFASLGLYSSSAKLQLPITSVMEQYKVGKARLIMMLKDSKDDKVKKAGVQVKTGRKWSASKAVEEAESRLRHKDIIGAVCQGRQGLGTTETQYWKGANAAKRRELVQREIREKEEEQRRSKAVEMGCQGAWTRWQTEDRALTWAEIWRYPPYQLQFLLRSVYDTLPSQANLHRWKLVDTPDCNLCGARGTLDHVLSSCHVALTQGRYTWRHDQVLREVADTLERERKSRNKPANPKAGLIMFVKEGQTKKPPPVTATGILHQAPDWKMACDLDKRLTFPEIVPTTLRPDIVLWSTAAKKLIVVELTVPWEERCEAAHERKRAKYDNLLAECRQQGWQTWNFPIEVGCRGFPAQSLWRMFSALGVTGRQRRSAVQNISKAAERASCWVWIKRNTVSWKPTTDTQ